MDVLLIAVSVPTGMAVLGGVSLLLLVAWLLAGMFGPTPRYKITAPGELPENGSPDFLNLLESLVDTKVNRSGRYEVLTNGPCFYPAQLEAIRAARASVDLEAYIFQRSEIGRLYLEALTERARAGVQVKVVLDAFGSLGLTRHFFRPLTEAGGRVSWYNGPSWYRLLQLDNRTHRELLVVDGKLGFIGGAGVADSWWRDRGRHARWRDTVLRVEGDAVSNLQATFAENWLACCGDLLTGEAYFPELSGTAAVSAHDIPAMVVNSTPTIGGATRARVLFQLLVASARKSISITTPYFLPDRSLTAELCHAVERGVCVRILVPGRKSDHFMTRSTSRGGYGPLLQAGAEVYEYEPAMIHAKVLVVDDLWSVVGSTNFDNRSFGLNDEVNLAVCDGTLARRLEADTAKDLLQSKRVSLEEWRHRPLTQRAPELIGWIFERQQ